MVTWYTPPHRQRIVNTQLQLQTSPPAHNGEDLPSRGSGGIDADAPSFPHTRRSPQPPWTSLPSVVTWHRPPPPPAGARPEPPWVRLALPVHQASAALLSPLQAIGENLASAWDLRDLAQDLGALGARRRGRRGRTP